MEQMADCAAVRPRRAAINRIRNTVGKDHCIGVFKGTLLELCGKRDIKGLCSEAKGGEIKAFPWSDDPYRAPRHVELLLTRDIKDPETCGLRILEELIGMDLFHKDGH